MTKYFLVSVAIFSVSISESGKPFGSVSWQCRINGEVYQYTIKRDGNTPVKNWFERGTTEVQYHAKNEARGGFLLWDKRPKREYKPTKKAKEVLSKMEKLI